MAAPLFPWNHSLVLNIQMIDTQHKRLVDLINALHDGMSVGKGTELLGRVLRELADYTRTHFADEERLLETHGYPGLADHHRIHAGVAARVQSFSDEFAGGRTALSVQLVRFLKDWLTQHIQVTDRKYVPHLVARGVK